MKDKDIKYKKFILRARLVGWCTDHGYRLTALGKDDRARCCGECELTKTLNYKGSQYHFLNQKTMIRYGNTNKIILLTTHKSLPSLILKNVLLMY